MSGRVTRGAAAKEAAFLDPGKEMGGLQLSSPPATPAPAQKKIAASKKTAAKKQTHKTTSKVKAPATPESDDKFPAADPKAESEPADANDGQEEKGSESPVGTGKKRKRTEMEEDQEYDELPHNLGKIARIRNQQVMKEEPKVKVEDDSTEHHSNNRAGKTSAVKNEQTPLKAAKAADKEAKATEKKIAADAKRAKSKAETQAKEARQAAIRYAEKKALLGLNGQAKEDGPDAIETSPAKKKKKTAKSETYGLHEGVSPYPNYPHPTPEECQEVHDVLLAAHKDEVHAQPQNIPPPSEFVAGCGEVPSILDALIRTMLSASTNGARANVASKGMRERFGLQTTGVGKGACDYNAVRRGPVEDLYYALAPGGLALTKSVNIKLLLDMVHEENQERRRQLLAAKEAGDTSVGPKGASTENEAQKAAEIQLAEDENLSLDHHYTLPTYDAMHKFMALPGIGVKTAACVALFCMQRPCFAVDTHCFRLGTWLGWVPDINQKVKGEPPVDRDPMFSHLEVRIPDNLKYMLHQLFLAHGKTCPRCKGGNHEGSKGWEDGCPIEHLVDRSRDKKKPPGSTPKAKSAKAAAKGKKAKKISEEDDDEEDEVPELDDQEETDEADEAEMEDDDDDDADFDDIHPRAKTPTKAKEPPKSKTPSKTKTSTKSEAVPTKGPTKPPPAKKARAAKTKSAPAAPKPIPGKPKKKAPPSKAWKGGKAVNSHDPVTESEDRDEM